MEHFLTIHDVDALGQVVAESVAHVAAVEVIDLAVVNTLPSASTEIIPVDAPS